MTHILSDSRRRSLGRLLLLVICYPRMGYALNRGTPDEVEQTVGMTTRAFVDDARENWQGTGKRPLNTVIWYPAALGSVSKPFAEIADSSAFFGNSPLSKDFTDIPVAYNAPLAVIQQKHPLVVLSHGSTSISLALMWLGSYLAAHGYIVAAVNHHGNTAAEGELLPQGFSMVWERAEDLTAVLTDFVADPFFVKGIDPRRIGAVGHSAGGATVIELAGGTFDGDRLERFCNSPESKGDGTCEPRIMIRKSIERVQKMKETDPVVQASIRRSTNSYRDSRIKGVLALAPALGSAFSKQSLSSIAIPVEIIAGDNDTVAPLSSNARRYAELIKGANLLVLPGANHMTFSSSCTPLGKHELDSYLDVGGLNREAVHEKVERMTLAFFENLWRES